MGIDFSVSGRCPCCKQWYDNVFSWTPRITFNHREFYVKVDNDAYEGMKGSKTLKELLCHVMKLVKHFPSTDRVYGNGDYHERTKKNASIGINGLLAWCYCNYKRHPNAEVSVSY